MDRIYTLAEAVKILKVSRDTLHRWEKNGILKMTRIGGRTFIKAEEIDRLLNS